MRLQHRAVLCVCAVRVCALQFEVDTVTLPGWLVVALLKKRDEERLRLEAAAAEQSATLGRRLDSFRCGSAQRCAGDAFPA